MSNNITDMNYFFSAQYAREELIKKLNEKGFKKEEIEKIIYMCDKDYKENNKPYPKIQN